MIDSSRPLVSVILPVYNCEKYIAASIESILTQTYPHFELIIIDDGSRDRSAAIIAKFADPRIKILSQENQGLSRALNNGIELAQGKYIARQDADDISLPERLEKQVAYLERHPDVGLLGASASILEGDAPTDRHMRYPLDNATLQFSLLFENRFVHSAVMMPRQVLQSVGPYATDPLRQPPEDYELWCRIARRYRIANLPDTLLLYRELPGSITRAKASVMRQNFFRLSSEAIAWKTGRDTEEEAVAALPVLLHGEPEETRGIAADLDALWRLTGAIQAGVSGAAGVAPETLQAETESLRAWLLRKYIRHMARSKRFGKLFIAACRHPARFRRLIRGRTCA